MPGLINAADAALLFSDEGLSSFALESLACGVPVIATPTGALPEVLHPGENGQLVSDVEEMVAAMESILRGAIPPSSSIARTVLEYAWRNVGPRLLAAYREVWDGHAA